MTTAQLDRALRTNAERRGSTLEKAAEIAYANILPGVTARYHLESARVKEDIVAGSAAALASVALRLRGDYEYAVAADQSVRVLDKESKEALFTFAPPRVYDAQGKEEIAQVQLESAEGYTRMTYRLSDGFLADAAYPGDHRPGGAGGVLQRRRARHLHLGPQQLSRHELWRRLPDALRPGRWRPRAFP